MRARLLLLLTICLSLAVTVIWQFRTRPMSQKKKPAPSFATAKPPAVHEDTPAEATPSPTPAPIATAPTSLPTPPPQPGRPPPGTPSAYTGDRVAAARKVHGPVIANRCAALGLTYPPRELFFRAFKYEGQFEAWGRDDRKGPMQKIATWEVLSASGKPGPKRREGDRQVPEGCYEIAVFNPQSNYHLSLGLNYPNAADRTWADPKRPGGEIYIHGGALTIGCLPLGDTVIEEVFLLAFDAHRKTRIATPVHIFPARMDAPHWDGLLGKHPEHAAFWSELRPIYDAFETTKQLPAIQITQAGTYAIAPE